MKDLQLKNFLKDRDEIIKNSKEMDDNSINHFKKVIENIKSKKEELGEPAKIVADYNSLNYKLDDRLIEIEMGKFTRMNYDDMFAKYGNVFLKFYENDPIIAECEVETFAEVQKRVIDMVGHIVKKHNNQNVVLVTHMDPIKSMLSTIMDLKPKTLFELIIANASLTIIKEHDEKFSLSAINAMSAERYS